MLNNQHLAARDKSLHLWIVCLLPTTPEGRVLSVYERLHAFRVNVGVCKKLVVLLRLH